MKTVAEAILEQLGGQRFIAMTGARNLMSDDARGRGSLTMKLPSTITRAHITHARITLHGSDDYSLVALKARGVNCVIESEMFGIHVENLQQAFTALTGLDTHL